MTAWSSSAARIQPVRPPSRSSRHTGERQSIDAGVMIVLIGAAPHTDWLTGAVALDDDGFVLRGAALNAAAGEREPWTRLARAPFPLEVIDEVYPVTVSSDDHAVENQKE